jgi:transposase
VVDGSIIFSTASVVDRITNGAVVHARRLAWPPLLCPINWWRALGGSPGFLSSAEPRLEDCAIVTSGTGVVTAPGDIIMATVKHPRVGTTRSLPVINPDAAGIDVGATRIYAAVPYDRAEEPVRSFETFTPDLHALSAWLKLCGIRTVAMESTGVYWIPVFQILESAGFKVCLVNARHVKNVPGRKTDVSDCQWLQYLHAVGLLRGSFRPEEAVCAVRSILRHRSTLDRYGSSHVQHIQKALTQMNLQLHHAISDITGKTGLAILDAILAGERDAAKLAKLRDYRIKTPASVIEKALVGDYRGEHLFTLRQALGTWRHYQDQIAECDREIERQLAAFEPREPGSIRPNDPNSSTSHSAPAEDTGSTPKATSPTRRRHANSAKAASAMLTGQLREVIGVNLTSIPGIAENTVSVLFSEVGRDLSAFPTCAHFASWLGLCPDNRITGGKVLSAKTRKVRSRAATALRLAANSLRSSKSALGDYFRRLNARLGAPKAITAVAHKLARIIYTLITTATAYDESVFAKSEYKYQQSRINRLHRQAAELGFTLTERAVS